ncbi:MAG: KH domain-containing protein [Akkermansia sp.]|nr:KH domain-containing protein [Akkermansia sp.]
MQQLIESIGKYLLAAVSPLIRHPENAEMRVAKGTEGNMVRFRLVLEQADVARVIGRNGMTASAIRSLAKAAGEKHGIKVVVHILSREEAEADAAV